MTEGIVDADIPIIDAHHHLWDRRPLPRHVRLPASDRYLLDELRADAVAGGHNVVATVYMECGAFYKADGPVEWRSIGETEAVNGIAAMSASGLYGAFRACAGIVGRVDLTLGERVRPLLEAHVVAGGGRFRGVRNLGGRDEDEAVLPASHRAQAGFYARPDLRAGVAALGALGLSFDAWVLEPQLPEVIDLARAVPDTSIILDFFGTPLGCGRYEGRREERFPIWRANIARLAECDNVVMKLGGLGMTLPNFPSLLADPPASAAQLAEEWRPYIETTIELFGPDRCLFASNYPRDRSTADYVTIWNAFKLTVAGASADEKRALFAQSATRVYRLDLP